jgi:diguanylate cyclase (GGDEF)-like protein
MGIDVPELDPASLNRTRLFEALGAVLRRADRTQRPAALLMVSVNALGAVNTQLGIDVGDELIAQTGRLLKSTLKSADTIGRYGSNTFAIIVDDCDPNALEGVATEMISLVEAATMATSVGPMAASVSVGGVVLPRHARTVSEAIQCALGAVAFAKQQPTGIFVAYTPEFAAERAVKREEAVSASVIGAIEEGRMLLMLQPVVRAGDHALAFYEGLLRLRRSDGVLLTASDFVEDAEKLGLARVVDKRALELALPLLAEHRGLVLSINISGLTAGDEDWLAALQAFVADRPDIPRRLIVEMTETAMVHDFDAAAVFFDRLRALGCRVALDDFGAGYTSFQHLRRLPVDMLKIDGSFVVNARHDEQARVLVTSMIDMATGLGLETVAEWVGDEETAALLEAAGVTYHQGFLFGQPMTIEELKQNGAL